jgi:hypothetical protein
MPNPQQRLKLRDALISAFPERSSLDMLLYFKLDKNLSQITPDSNLETVIFKLIQTAEAEEWLLDLVRAAREDNPGNSQLKAIADELLINNSPSNETEVLKQQEQQSTPTIAPKPAPSDVSSKFDVFLCHNSEDKDAVIEIANRLKNEYNIKPWLDIWEFQPGKPWQPELERQINNIKSAAVFVGESGIGPWQRQEIDAFLRQFVSRGCPVIPLLLNNASQQPVLPLFLQGMMWVDFRRNNSVYVDPMAQLAWGITGKQPPELLIESEVGANYNRLKEFLQNKNFKEADFETTRMILWILNKKIHQSLTSQDFQKIPFIDLRTINNLWLTESKQKFGFKAQKEVWINSSSNPEKYDYHNYQNFIEALEWKKEDVPYDLRAKKGHFPKGLYVLTRENRLYEKYQNEYDDFLNKIIEAQDNKMITLQKKIQKLERAWWVERDTTVKKGVFHHELPPTPKYFFLLERLVKFNL